MERTLSIIAVAALAIGAGWTARAGEQAGANLPSFDELDADGNGTISLDEAGGYTALQRVFARADTDRDGRLGREEYAAAKEAIAPEAPGG